MFKDLYPIARHTPLSIIVQPAGDKLTLIIIPRPDGTKEEALSKPIQVTGTPEELDAELPAKLAEYSEAYNAVRSNLGESIEALNAAKGKTAAKAAKRKATPAPKPAKKKARPTPPKLKKRARPTPPAPKKKAAPKPAPRRPAPPARAAAAPKAPAAATPPTVLNPADDWPFPTR